MLLLFLSLMFASSISLQEMTEEEAVDLAAKTLTEELDIDAGEAEVVSALQVRWPNSSLGCPQKGLSYLQVIIPGYRVVLRHDNQTYRVHVGDGRAIVCRSSKPGRKAPGRKESHLSAIRVSQLAQRDLASRLDVEVDQIKVNVIKPTTWPDTSLGCPEEGKTYENVETEGYVIELVYLEETFEYHSDQRRPVFCKKR
jgi:hypothetical protein